MAARTKAEMIEKSYELEEIACQMRDLLDQARDVIRGTGIIGQRAEAYWFGHMRSFLDDDGRSCTTVLDTINELRCADEDD